MIQKRPIPRKLNSGMIQALSTAIANGNYAVTACQLCDINERSLYEWLEQAQLDYQDGLTEEESLYICLNQSLKKAEAKAEAELVEVVREAGTVKREWLPAMTFLERRHPDRWGRRERHDVNIESKTLNITRVEVVRPQVAEIVEGEVRKLKEGEDEIQ